MLLFLPLHVCVCSLVLGLPCQMAMVGGGWWWWWWWWWWCVSLNVLVTMKVVFANTSGGRSWKAENLKPSQYGLILGLPCQMAMVGGAGWWWCISFGVAAVVGITFAGESGGRGVWGQKPKTKHKGSVLGCVFANTAEIGCCIYTETHHVVT